ncbi:HpcH/HpaI aldolase/citrate lyase family protein [Shewanella sp. GutDb-MelDb]|uniref:HpcH/HpaI aldolase family protein n=1 Tax=Shewanella sp. GutDb-MelDb TaxID=2058316 RepID=UPI000C7DE42A|nr:aldolase/citrate lyase family protein [Shewanella sp. GutDb-MelDb]PKG56860.1 siderophore biosynthesis protein SbnG [Shewanella sp. GutDb-MelDb]
MPFSNALKSKLAKQDIIYGILNSVPSPVICEMFAYAGFDFAVIDTEHVLISDETLAHCIRAADCSGLTLLVRVPDDAPLTIAKVLDAGAAGILVSRVSSLEMVKNAIKASKYPPISTRGITGGSNTGFGTLAIDQANDETLVCLMIEDAAGMASRPEIVALDHVDMILESALDLSLSLGYGTQVNHPAVQAQIHKMAQICRDNNIAFCAIPRTPEQQVSWHQKGTQAFLLGEDRGMIFKHFKQQLEALKNTK